MMPIGPAPVISTSSPTTGNDSAVCTALPNGSKIAATSRSTGSLCTQALLAGSATYSANAPGTWTPRPRVLMHRCRRPARQLRQRPQTRWPSPLTRSPTATSRTPAPISTTSPQNSCPVTIGTGTFFCAQWSQLWMCRSVPHNPGAEHLDQDLVGLDLRLRNVLQPQTGLGLGLDQCLHGTPPPSTIVHIVVPGNHRRPSTRRTQPLQFTCTLVRMRAVVRGPRSTANADPSTARSGDIPTRAQALTRSGWARSVEMRGPRPRAWGKRHAGAHPVPQSLRYPACCSF